MKFIYLIKQFDTHKWKEIIVGAAETAAEANIACDRMDKKYGLSILTTYEKVPILKFLIDNDLSKY